MIKRYLKKPILVEAVRWDGTNKTEIEEFVGEKTIIHSGTNSLVLLIPEGCQLMRLGDYLVDDIDSGISVYDPDYFGRVYEVGESDA